VTRNDRSVLETSLERRVPRPLANFGLLATSFALNKLVATRSPLTERVIGAVIQTFQR
jgi:hypothetical protein